MNRLYRLLSILLLMVQLYGGNRLWASNDQSPSANNVIPGVVVARLKPGAQIQEMFFSTNYHYQSVLKIESAFPRLRQPSSLARIYKISFPAQIPPREMAVSLMQQKIFEYVEPRYLSYIQAIVPNDSLLSKQFHLEQISIFSAWDRQQGSPATVIAIVDNGTDYQHPDLQANIWSNSAEANGTAGVDDDGNGYIDDIHGWDFGNNDGDPNYGTDAANITAHGTHTAGIAGAVTNNYIGIAGASWNCQIMPVKVATDDNANAIPFGYEGIVYAADNGAKIISNSWGRSGDFSQFEQDVIDYAVGKGCIVVAAGGNNDQEGSFYPASYLRVIAVAAVNDRDEKASYASYGKYIDLAAPGGDRRVGRPGILSTYPISRGGYGEMSGSSMAAPLVAGVLGLLVNHFPDDSPLQLARQIVLSSDAIDNLNPKYAGLLGHGRLNAFRSLTETDVVEQPAKIQLFKVAITDSGWGNGNFIFERNETIGIDAWYRNFAVSPGGNMLVTLTLSDPDLMITKGQTVMAYLPPDSLFGIQRSLAFQINSQAPPKMVPLVLSYSFRNGIFGNDTLFTLIGKTPVLLVDDDTGDRNVEGYYETALQQFGIPYLRWDHSLMGTPPAPMLAHFPLVIWFCEWAFPSLTADDRMTLKSYMDQGGSLFLSGQDIGWDLADPSGVDYSEYSASSVQFFENYLHASYRSDHSGSSRVIGMPGTIGQELSFDIYQPQITIHFQYPDWIEPTANARSSFRYQNDRGAGITYQQNYQLLYLGFGFEAIDAKQDEDPARFSRPRMELMQRILNQLGPIRHEPLRDQEMAPESQTIIARISATVNDLQSLSLFWKNEYMSDFAQLEMTQVNPLEFQQRLNLSNYQGRIAYYFKLMTPYYDWFLPVTAAERPFSFVIAADQTPPEIGHVSLNDIFLQPKERSVQAYVEDNIVVNPQSVWLHYRVATKEDSSRMVSIGDGWFQATIPPIAEIGDSIGYYFTASDLATHPNRAVSPNFGYHIGRDGFEFGTDFWQTNGNGWALDSNAPHSGFVCMTTFPGTNYPNNASVSLQSKFGIRQRDLKDRWLRFWTKYDLEPNADFGLVEISVDGGSSWQRIGNRITGSQLGWTRLQYDLSPFFRDSSDTLLLRFRLQTDGNQQQPMSGWSIDDIAVEKGSASDIRLAELETAANRSPIRLLMNAPNPFNDRTTIRYELAHAGEVWLEVYNLLGQIVMKTRLGFHEAGSYRFIWEANDSQGRALDSGIYFCRLIWTQESHPGQAKHVSRTMKLVYLR
ncbi:MAG: S8 family serine peptidase [candidate division KSB1 bacterium]|nr:S8 family serine peptidase [candidate division KSB1 bacterium]MDZ7341409.1 S8 family serine peptidase [candidate division KSB1 bacterium]